MSTFRVESNSASPTDTWFLDFKDGTYVTKNGNDVIVNSAIFIIPDSTFMKNMKKIIDDFDDISTMKSVNEEMRYEIGIYINSENKSN